MALGDGVSAIASLAVTFGGFSPTAMDEVNASRSQIEQMERLQAEKKEQRRRQLELERARTSQPRTYLDADGTVWTYVVVDGELVRIIHCDSTVSSLVIPDTIDGMRVYALGPEACARLERVESIVCPDTVEFIGACAFRLCPELNTISLPAAVNTFTSTWLQHCPKLAHITLPGKLDVITSEVFDNKGIKSIAVGSDVYRIEPGAFQDTHLAHVSVDPRNPYIDCDGAALYSRDGKALLALALPVETYSVRSGCETICKKACYGALSLADVKLPSTVENIEPFAFAFTGLRHIAIPSSVVKIGEKAFLHCKELAAVELAPGLESIEGHAFADSGLEALEIPATIRHIGSSITVRSKVIHAGPNCSIAIDAGCAKLFLDGQGGLYKRESDGPHLVQLIDRAARTYRVLDGAVAIDDYAFAYHDTIEEVIVASSVQSIGRNAFRICTKLRNALLPDSIVEIGDEAFLDTALESFRVPRDLKRLGSNALITYGAHHGDKMPSLAHVEVASGNELFFVKDGMLCRRIEGGVSIVVFTSSSARVVFPEDATRIEEYAFNNARGIDYLGINAKMQIIATSGLATWCWIRQIHVELPEPLEGRDVYDFFFPDTPRSIHGISVGIGGSSWVNVPGIVAQYDICIANARDYNAPRSSDNISAYEQAKLVLGRLSDPIMLTSVNRGMFERLLRIYVLEICVDIARHDDRALLDELVERGFVNEDNIDSVIKRVNVLQDAAMTAYLLEVKRRRFARAAIDFDL